MHRVRAQLKISGRVQGVNFRSFTKREAIRLGLTGWVKNLPDGKVEAVIEGKKTKVEKLIQKCQIGPPLAIVRDMKILWKPIKSDLETFIIKY